jgi:hypothetical protein
LAVRRRSPIVLLLAASAVVLAWVVVAFIQGAFAWGYIGMSKPVWFIVLSYAVWAGPPVVAASVVVLIVVRVLGLAPKK